MISAAPDSACCPIPLLPPAPLMSSWTGNRVTCRDWFQLTLKEGLTVFRDQGFSADMNSAPVKRIEVRQRKAIAETITAMMQ